MTKTATTEVTVHYHAGEKWPYEVKIWTATPQFYDFDTEDEALGFAAKVRLLARSAPADVAAMTVYAQGNF